MNNPVSRKILTKILEAGRVAPSAKKRQPWKFIIFSETEKDKLLDCIEKGILREEKKSTTAKITERNCLCKEYIKDNEKVPCCYNCSEHECNFSI